MRTFLSLVVAGVALTLFASDTQAHGGKFRGPGDRVPPHLRDPHDPTPPPPPPPSPVPTPTPTPVPTPTPTPVPASPTPTAPPQTPTPDVTSGRRGRRTPDSFEDWTFWYHNNNEHLENLKERLYELYSTPNSIFGVGDGRGQGQRSSATRLTAKKVQKVVIPALLWAMDPKNSGYSDTEAAAYLALAKVTRDPEHIRTIVSGLDLARRRPQDVRESAALALGLLRRQYPTDQFSARELDGVRETLFEVFENDRHATRTRGFAAIALGLLGDQPTGSGDYAGDRDAAERTLTARLFGLLEERYASPDLPVGLLMAIGLQPPTSVTSEHRELLARCALKGRWFRDRPGALVRSYAALTLGRIGTAADIKHLENVLMARQGVDHNIRRSAIIGLGLLGRLVSGEDRVEVARIVLRGLDRVKDNTTRNFGLISLAYLLIEDAKAGVTDVLGNTKAEEVLLHTARRGSYVHRPFGALALGLLLREVTDELDIEAYQEFRESALLALRAGIEGRGADAKVRAAFCVALGIARDLRTREPLRLLVADRRADKMLRGYAALGLGLMDARNAEAVKTIAAAMRERSSEDLRRQTAVALGLLGNPRIPGTGKDAVELLIDELKVATTQSHKGEIVLALAQVGDHRAVDHLVAMLKDPAEKDLTQALACAGLGLIGDLEYVPSLARGSRDINYRASTNVIDWYLSIL